MSGYRRWSSYWWRYDVMGFPRNAWEFLKSVWRYREFLWNDLDGDWLPLALVMEMKLRFMSEGFRKNRIIERWQEPHEETGRAAHLLRRLIDDEYATEAGWTDDRYFWDGKSIEERREVFRLASERQHADLRELGELIGTKLLGWWD